LWLPAPQIVVEARLDGQLFLLLSAPPDLLPATVIDIDRRHVAEVFVLAVLLIVLDKLRHRARQRLLRFPALVKSLGELQRRHPVIQIQSQDLPD